MDHGKPVQQVKPLIIAFGNRKGVGKTLAANLTKTTLLQDPRFRSVVVVSFASKLKAIAFDLYKHLGLKDEAYYEENYSCKGVTLPEIGKTPRDIWIELGIKMREIYPNTWCDVLYNINANVIIVSDLRFPNEVEVVKKLGGHCVQIIRPSMPPTDDPADNALSGQDWADWTICNDGTTNDYYRSLSSVLQGITTDYTLRGLS